MRKIMNTAYKTIKSPIGDITLIADQKHLLAVLWKKVDAPKIKIPLGEKIANHPVLLETEKQLNEYFNGKRKKFTLPIKFSIGTNFQKNVWKALIAIPYGQTISYSEMAKKIGSPKACRAVGAASSKNPISIIAPCHRVIGKNGSLTGFAGGLKCKDFLLRLEQR